jgi:hypothetical protein
VEPPPPPPRAKPAPVAAPGDQVDAFGLPSLKSLAPPQRLTFKQLADKFTAAKTVDALQDLAVKYEDDCKALSFQEAADLRTVYKTRAAVLKPVREAAQ